MPQRLVDFNTYQNYWDSRKHFKSNKRLKEYIYLKEMGFSKYRDLIREINEACAKQLIESPMGIKLTNGMGELTIKKRRNSLYELIQKTNKFDVDKLQPQYKFLLNNCTDWKATKEAGKRVLFTNDHSDGYKFILFWNKHRTTFPHKQLYYIELEDKWNKYLANWVRAGNQHYGILNPVKYKKKLLAKNKI